MVSKDLVAATSTPLILSILSTGESYGYAIIKRVRELSGNELEWTDGMLYPVLHRLKDQGHVISIWRTAENRRRRKYYRITTSGRRELGRLREQWDTVNSTLTRAWDQMED
ncbi:MAG: PadR family transcriptional regulator [Verrucomicrobia bacterium]|nr:PadR family transcriptional regulator [Verrucomicrobiota bacterium]